MTVVDVVPHDGQDAVLLPRTARTAEAGRYNLWLEGGGWVKIGQVANKTTSTVTRVIDGETPVKLEPGRRVSWSGIYYRDPADAGLDATDIMIETPAGPAPAWLIGPWDGSDRWAIHIHGLGSQRAGTLRGVEAAKAVGLISLIVSYRNDGEGPAVGAGRSTLGVAELEDVRAAARYAIAQGARRIVLFGWSMGAAIALQLAADAEFRDAIDCVVLESPVLDWQSTINANCERAGLPSWFGRLARPWLQSRALSWLIGLEVSVPLDRFDWIDRASQLSVPALILQSVDDTSTRYDVSCRLANLRRDLVRLETFHADHTLSWNSAPERWRHVVQAWLLSDPLPSRRGMDEGE